MFMLGAWISESSTTTSLLTTGSGVLGDGDVFGANHDMPRSRRIVPGLRSRSSCAIRRNRLSSSSFMSAFGDLGGEAAPGLGSTSVDAILEHVCCFLPSIFHSDLCEFWFFFFGFTRPGCSSVCVIRLSTTDGHCVTPALKAWLPWLFRFLASPPPLDDDDTLSLMLP